MPDVPHSSGPPVSDTGKLLALLESLSAPLAILGVDGSLLTVNSAWRNSAWTNPFVAGIAEEEDYRAVCQQILSGADSRLSIVAMGILSVLKGGIPRLNLEYPCQEPDGQHWYGLSATRTDASTGLSAIIQHHDITEKMLMDQRLRRSESLFRITTENALDLISILDAAGVPIYNSPSYQKVLGYSAAEMGADRFLALVHEEDRPGFGEALARGLKTGMSQIFEFRMAHRDGAWRHLEAQAVMVENPHGTADTVLLISRDVSARKEAEERNAQMEIQLRHAQKLEAIGQLAAGIAHEINTPTQFIGDNLRFIGESVEAMGRVCAAYGDLARQAEAVPGLAGAVAACRAAEAGEEMDYLLAETPRAVAQSLDGTHRVATIVRAMKVFSYPGGEDPVAVDLNDAIRNTLIVSRNEWKFLAEVATDLDPALPQVFCHPEDLNQALLNLVVNAAHAIEATDRVKDGGKGEIFLGTRSGADWVEILVRDNGCGIPESLRERIWLPFFTTKGVGKGTGQGLSIVHGVVTRHGGTIRVESEVGEGTTFILRLPLAPPARQTG